MNSVLKNVVYEYRTKKEMTQQELADLVGVTRQTIIAIEKGNYTPSVTLAMDIAHVFSKKVEDMFYYET